MRAFRSEQIMKIKKKKLLKYFKKMGKTYQKEAEIAARDGEELNAIEEEIISRFASHRTTNKVIK
jgi:hypothetical protein